MKTGKLFNKLAAMAFVFFAVALQAQQVPQFINYQGKLLDGQNLPVNGNLDMEITIFDAATGGNLLYSETQNVRVDDGLFNVAIGSVTPLPPALFSAASPVAFLGIKVDGTALPRRRLTSVAAALHSGTGDISSVTAGAGLAGGGTTGDVALRIADGGVTSRKILDGTITADDFLSQFLVKPQAVVLAAGAVNTNEIADSAVTGIKIADGAVRSRHIANSFMDLGRGGAENGKLQVISSPLGRGVEASVETNDRGLGDYDVHGKLRTLTEYASRTGMVPGVSTTLRGDGLQMVGGGLGNITFFTRSTAHFGVGTILAFGDDDGFFGGDPVGAGMDNLGNLWADVKNFRMPHPKHPGQEIWYAAIEGPEAAAYLRGTARLNNGRCSIAFPEHFQIVANPQGMTVLLTPLDAGSKGLAVAAKSARGIEVEELRQGAGSYEFDWEVKSVRKGHEDYRPVRNRREFSQARSKQTVNPKR